MKIYEYKAGPPMVYDLSVFTATNSTPVNFNHLLVYAYKGDRLIMASDSEGYITILQPKKNMKHINFVNYEFKARLFTGENKPMLGFSKNQHNVLYVHQKFIGFIKTSDASISTFSCKIAG